MNFSKSRYISFISCPDMTYRNLEGVHNGNETMNLYPQIAFMPPEQVEKDSQQLLKYCSLDTLAKVKLWQELERVCGN